MKGVYCINGKKFYTVLRVAGVILFFGICQNVDKNDNSKERFIEWLVQIF